MNPGRTSESAETDAVDRQIIHALQLDGRAAFSEIASVLEVSEQTVARRYRRLRSNGIVRVLGLVDPKRLGQTDWQVRVQCRPEATLRLAEALARRPDVSWVSVMAGGSEVVGVIRSQSEEQRDHLLLSQLPNSSQVLGLTAHATLHRFIGPLGDGWVGYDNALPTDKIRKLAYTVPAVVNSVGIEESDRPMLDILVRDGRATYATLAQASGLSEGRAARRIEALRSSGTLYFDVDLASGLMGFTTSANLWLIVEPAHLAEAGRQISEHAEVPFTAAVTGSTNLLASVYCRDIDELYKYVTVKLAAVPGIRQVEVSPVLRRIKQAGALRNGLRLADPPPPSAGSRR